MSRVSRRSFIEQAGVTLAASSFSQAGRMPGGVPGDAEGRGSGPAGMVRYGVERCVAEWAYTSGKAYADPSNALELDVVFTDPQGREQRVPAFWAGDGTWRIRYSPPRAGRYTYRTVAATRPMGTCTGRLECWKSRRMQARTRCAGMVRWRWPRTAATSSTRTARRSSGWGTPGGWGCAPVALAGGLPAVGCGPREQRIHRHADHRRPLPRHAALRRAGRQRGGVPLGRQTTRASIRATSIRRTCASSTWWSAA